MTVYRLVNHGYSFKKIMHGRKWVGRVYQHATTKRYHGKIGGTEAIADGEETAFREVVAKHLGYSTAAALNQRNQQVRRSKSAARARGRQLANQYMRATTMDERFAVFDQIFDLGKKP